MGAIELSSRPVRHDTTFTSDSIVLKPISHDQCARSTSVAFGGWLV